MINYDDLDIRGSLKFGDNVYIDVNVIFIGEVILGDNIKIGPNCIISDTTIGDNTQVKEYSSLDGSVIGKNCIIGPYARIRPSSDIGFDSQIGNFVEIKNTIMGDGCKINHHSFIGDAVLGSNVIIGAGCITCNFDGKNTVITVINDKVYIGAGVQLIAPILIGANAIIGAGSTITDDVDECTTVIARARQVTVRRKSV